MAELPTPGGSNNVWGTMLNDFLDVAHNTDGSLQPSAITAAGGYVLPSGGIPSTDLSSAVQTELTSISTAIQTSAKGQASGVASLDTSALIPSAEFGNTIAAPVHDKGGQVFNVMAYGATGNGTTDDTAAINAAIAAASSGDIVFLPGGLYKVSSPIVIPPCITFQGAMRTFWYPSEGGTSNGVLGPTSRIMGSSSFSTNATVNGSTVPLNGIVALVEEHTGGYTSGSANQVIKNIIVDGSNLPHGNSIDGFYTYGSIMGVTMSGCGATNVGGHGIETAYAAVFGEGYGYLNELEMLDCVFYNCGGDGVHLVATADSTFTACHVIACTGNAWYLDQVGNTRLLGCKAEWSVVGWYVTWPSGYGNQPRMTFVGCSTDYNTTDGVYINGNQTGGVVLFSGCDFHADGHNGTSTAAGIHVTGAAYPVMISNCAVIMGPTATGSTNPYGPGIGFKSDSTPTFVSVDNSTFQGYSSGWTTDGTGTVITAAGVVSSTGGTPTAPNTPTASVLMAGGGVRLNGSSSTYSGSGVPSSSLGANGDYFFRTDTPGTANQRIYVKSAGAWAGII
jgi:hypothetical protein